MTKDEALRTAYSVLSFHAQVSDAPAEPIQKALDAIEEALAQPVQRTWVGLTDDDIKEIVGPWGDTPIKGYTRQLFDKIEAKLREKNQ
jgi:hypothetical protein